MKDVGIFKKVTKREFGAAFRHIYPNFDFDTKTMDAMYDTVNIPERKTFGSAGYDFVTPFPFTLYPGCKIIIPTGIRVEILKEEWMLTVVPKSRTAHSSIRFSNTIGIVDPDYYHADNEGHIRIILEMPKTDEQMYQPIACFGKNLMMHTEPLQFKAGDGIGQGIFLPFGITANEDTTNMCVRTGGFGSTGN